MSRVLPGNALRFSCRSSPIRRQTVTSVSTWRKLAKLIAFGGFLTADQRSSAHCTENRHHPGNARKDVFLPPKFVADYFLPPEHNGLVRSFSGFGGAVNRSVRARSRTRSLTV